MPEPPASKEPRPSEPPGPSGRPPRPRDLLARADLPGLFERALAEDGLGIDITTLACRPPRDAAVATARARTAQTLAGLEALPALVEASRLDVTLTPLAADGDRLGPGAGILTLAGPAPDLLAIERPLLNTLSRLSGIATHTRRFVDAVPQGCPAQVFDTRKTTPGWRLLEKYAVVCGGGRTHRLGLHDAVLIKDNHLAARPAGVPLADFLRDACERARREFEPDFVEVEVDTLEQLDEVLSLDRPLIDYVLLDNFSLESLAEAVRRRDAAAPAVRLEASGNVSLATIADIARTGVERISAGALTHQATWTDIGLDFD
ncbi:MAG: carboxylating nicotinate-nucleotide diphosphorylase [Planctomycetota bacterium]